MSFSSNVKEELSRLIPKPLHCKIAELAAAVMFAGEIGIGTEQKKITIRTEQVILAKKYFTLIKKIFGFNAVLNIRAQAGGQKSHQYSIILKKEEEVRQVLEKVPVFSEEQLKETVLERDCCKRAFIRGAFLAAGSMSNPGKSYHLEIVCRQQEQAQLLQGVIENHGLPVKIVQRKKRYIVYLKDSERIFDLLNLMGAHRASMELENVRIIKEMRNAANRQYNCDAANINKLVKAASRQLDDIRFLQEHMGLKNLSPSLYETAAARLEHPDVSLQELGKFLNPPVGKSGINHRLRKIGVIADELRAKMDEQSG